MSVTSLTAFVNVYGERKDYAQNEVTRDGVDTVGAEPAGTRKSLEIPSVFNLQINLPAQLPAQFGWFVFVDGWLIAYSP